MLVQAGQLRWMYATLVAWAVILLLRATALGGEWRTLSAYAWSTMAIWIIAYAVGFSAAIRTAAIGGFPASAPSRRWLTRWTYILSLAAIAGAGLIAYEFAVRRGYGFTTPVALIRATEVEGVQDGSLGGSWISGIGRLLTPALQVAWILAAIYGKRQRRHAWGALLLATATVLWEQIMFEGGRFFLAGLVAAAMVARSMRPREPGELRERFDPRRWMIIGVTAVAALGLFGYIFVDRALALDMDFSAAYSMFLSNFDIDAPPETLRRLDGAGGALWFAFYMFWMYMCHSPNSFDELLNYPYLSHAYGLVQFSLVGQALSKVTGASIGYDQYVNMPNPGAYTTIIGPNYMDFGVGGSWIAALVLGYLTARWARRLGASVLGRFGLAAPLMVAIGLFSPIVSLVVNLWPAIVWAGAVGATARRSSTQPRVLVVASGQAQPNAT